MERNKKTETQKRKGIRKKIKELIKKGK